MTKNLPISQICPDRDAWSAFCLGQVDARLLQALVGHLDSCTTCRDVLVTVRPDPDELIEEIRRGETPDPFSDEPECHAVVQKLQSFSEPKGVPPEASVPERLGEYRILGPLGRGGMGAVYRAVHLRLGREVALKTFPPGRASDASAVVRFHREMAALGKLDHPHVVRATDAGEQNGVAFLVMELVDGIDLARLVKSLGPRPVAEACELARQAALGLQHLAVHGLVHRDIKPSNLVLTREGTVKILDLGLALVPHDSGSATGLTATGQVVGTVDFMAPEQADHARLVDSRADLYSLGCTLFYLLTGHAPFTGPNSLTLRSKLTAHATAPLPSLQACCPEAPAELEKVLHRLLAKEPNDRYSSPLKAAAALAPLGLGANLADVQSHEIGVDPPPLIPPLSTILLDATPKQRPPSHRFVRRSLLPAAAILLLAGAVAAALNYRNDSPPPATDSETQIPKKSRGDDTEPSTVDLADAPLQAKTAVYPVAIFTFEHRDTALRDLVRSATDLLVIRLAANPTIVLVERSELQKSLDELQLGLSGAVQPDSANRVGQLTGAKLLISGSILRVDKKIFLTAKIIGTETGRLLGTSSEGPADGELAKLVETLAEKIEVILKEKLSTLVPATPTHADRALAIKARLGSRARPTLAIRAGSTRDLDGAAVTEMARLAKDCGFEVRDAETGPSAAVVMTLETLADASSPHGKLVPAKARVAIKAVESASGTVLVADRQTAMTVDLTPELATRLATETAAMQLAERVLPQLMGKP